MNRKRKAIGAGIGIAVLAGAVIYVNFGRSGRSAEAEAAARAAAEIVRQQGGGEQPKNAEGVPLDAVIDPSSKPGQGVFGR